MYFPITEEQRDTNKTEKKISYIKKDMISRKHN